MPLRRIEPCSGRTSSAERPCERQAGPPKGGLPAPAGASLKRKIPGSLRDGGPSSPNPQTPKKTENRVSVVPGEVQVEALTTRPCSWRKRSQRSSKVRSGSARSWARKAASFSALSNRRGRRGVNGWPVRRACTKRPTLATESATPPPPPPTPPPPPPPPP